MCTTPRKILLSLKYMDPNALSPIPEMVSSYCATPGISPEPFLEPSSKSAKLLSPASKITKVKKLDKRELNLKIEKKLNRLTKAKKRPEVNVNVSEIDSHAIYMRNKQELLKLLPNSKEFLSNRYRFVSRSPERPDSSNLGGKRTGKRSSVPKHVYNEVKSPGEKTNARNKDIPGFGNKPNKRITEIIKKYSKKNLNFKISKNNDFTSEEVRGITKNMLYK